MKEELVLITGGSSGIGEATARLLCKQGARVIIVGRDQNKLDRIIQSLSESGHSINGYSADLSIPSEAKQLASRVQENHGVPNQVICSAGAGEWLTMEEADHQHYYSTINSPYLATANTIKSFHNIMKDRGNGQFIVVNSAACFFSFPGATGYLPARWALLGLCKALQADFKKSKFTLSMTAFGKIDSPYFTNNPISEERIPKAVNLLIPVWSVDRAAQSIVSTINRASKIYVFPWQMRINVVANRIFPGLYNWLMR